MRISDPSRGDEVVSALQSAVGEGSEVVPVDDASVPTLLRFRLPPRTHHGEGREEGINLPDLFEALEACSRESDLVSDYSVSQTTLEQVCGH